MKRMVLSVRDTGRVDAQHRWWVGGFLAADCEKVRLNQEGRIRCSGGVFGCPKKNTKDEKRKMEEEQTEVGAKNGLQC